MEKSNSKTSQKFASGAENEDRKDEEQPTTSRGDTLSPEQTSNNMNDMKSIDFNSADEVRQAMKAIFAGKAPQPFSEEATHFQPTLNVPTSQNNPEPIKINDLVQNKSLIGPEVRKTVPRQVQHNLYRKMKTGTQVWTCKSDSVGTSGLKRPGRPPKAGPSKVIKKQHVSSMYLGKLSNVVPFRRRRRHWESESESDVESVVIFY